MRYVPVALVCCACASGAPSTGAVPDSGSASSLPPTPGAGIDSGIPEATDAGIVDVPDAGIVDVPDGGNVGVPDGGNVGVPDGGSGTSDAPDAGSGATVGPDGGVHWSYVAPGGGDFASSGPGDLWSGTSHLDNGQWQQPVRISGESFWFVGPDEFWSLEQSTLHHWAPWIGDVVTDLSRPNRVYSLLQDGWISYLDRNPNTVTLCDGAAGIARLSGGSLKEYPLNACDPVTSISGDFALAFSGATYKFDGKAWSGIPGPQPFAGGMSMYAWEGINETAPDDVLAWGWGGQVLGSHYDGAAWSDFFLENRVPISVWSKPWGPRWIVANSAWGVELFEFVNGSWEDRGPPPASGASSGGVVGSDGIDVYFACYDGIFKYKP